MNRSQIFQSQDYENQNYKLYENLPGWSKATVNKTERRLKDVLKNSEYAPTEIRAQDQSLGESNILNNTEAINTPIVHMSDKEASLTPG